MAVRLLEEKKFVTILILNIMHSDLSKKKKLCTIFLSASGFAVLRYLEKKMGH